MALFLKAVVIVFSNTCSYSRKIIWLKLTPTNSDPKVVAKFYLQSIEEVNVPNYIVTEQQNMQLPNKPVQFVQVALLL